MTSALNSALLQQCPLSLHFMLRAIDQFLYVLPLARLLVCAAATAAAQSFTRARTRGKPRPQPSSTSPCGWVGRWSRPSSHCIHFRSRLRSLIIRPTSPRAGRATQRARPRRFDATVDIERHMMTRRLKSAHVAHVLRSRKRAAFARPLDEPSRVSCQPHCH